MIYRLEQCFAAGVIGQREAGNSPAQWAFVERTLQAALLVFHRDSRPDLLPQRRQLHLHVLSARIYWRQISYEPAMDLRLNQQSINIVNPRGR